jgi:hypothetical protein
MVGVGPRDVLQDIQQADEAEALLSVRDKRIDGVALGPNNLLHAIPLNPAPGCGEIVGLRSIVAALRRERDSPYVDRVGVVCEDGARLVSPRRGPASARRSGDTP